MIKLADLIKECGDCERQGVDYTHGHDHEASMAESELRDLISNASKLQNIIQPGDQLPGWVSAYISLASDYMHSVAEYMIQQQAEMGDQGEEATPGYAVYEGLGEGSNFEIAAEKLSAARIPCRLKEVDGQLVVELGFNYPDELVDAIYSAVGSDLANQMEICADQSGGSVTNMQRIAGGPKRY